MDDKTIENNIGVDVTPSSGRKPYRAPQLVALGDDLVQGNTGTGCDSCLCSTSES